jgi:uncharacterized protein (TIGR02145 family)
MQPIEALRHEIRELLVQDPEAAIAKLKAALPTGANRQKDVLMLQARWEELEREMTKGTIAREGAELRRNQIFEGLLDTIGDLTESDLKPAKANTQPKWLWPTVGGVAAIGLVAFLFFGKNKSEVAAAGVVALPTNEQRADSFTDPRDGQRYRTVRLAGHTWMAENLRFQTPNAACYADDPANCNEHGRLYPWQDVFSACPEGWHLPSTTEWKDLALNAGGYQLNVKTPPDVMGNPAQALAALSLGGNTGFDATASGYHDATRFDGLDKFGGYWSSSKAYREYVMAVVFDTWREKQLILEGTEQDWKLSCRCVKN